MIVSLSMLQVTSLSMYTTKQSFITECRTNYRTKFNFICIKKTEGVPKIFLKDRQIKNFKLLYI